jgi:formyltetrahydrofolate synthetase
VKAAVYGLVGGGALWAGLSALYWLTHQTANNEKELGKIINVPCLGTLPKVKGQYRKGNCPIISDKNDKFGFNESVRLLRVRAEKALGKNGGKVLMVTSTIPNEGKTTVSVGLALGLNKIGKKAVVALREPSLGPCFGMKGGAAGGGYAQILPMEKINLHFTGDMHAVTSDHNMISALLDNYNYSHQAEVFALKEVVWNRVLDVNDRS